MYSEFKAETVNVNILRTVLYVYFVILVTKHSTIKTEQWHSGAIRKMLPIQFRRAMIESYSG